MSSRPKLHIDWCSYEAAKFAVMNWHYSKSMPSGKLIKFGIWENTDFIGSVIYGRGSNKEIGKPFGITQLKICELVRVALRGHGWEVSKIISICNRIVKKHFSGLRLIISFADPNEGHSGSIYQAGNWIYTGHGTEDKRSRPYRRRDGSIAHWRTVAGDLASKGLRSTIEDALKLGYIPLDQKPKHRYLYPLDKDMRRQIEPLAKPYPKREPAPAA